MQGYNHTLIIALAAADDDGIAESQSPGSGAITINGILASGGVATLDVARRVIVTSGGDDSSITFTITGTDRYGRAQSETISGADTSAAQSARDYLTVSSVAHSGSVAGTVIVGTNGVASTAPLIVDTYSNNWAVGVTLDFSGTANASIQVANDDLSPTPTNPLAWDMATSSPSWSSPSSVSSKTSLTQAQLAGPFSMIRLTQNSFTSPGYCTAKINLPFGVGRY